MEAGTSIVEEPSIFIRAAAIISGAFSTISVLVASYVYFKFPHSAEIQHVVVSGLVRTTAHLESIESYIFSVHCGQVLVFVALTLAAIRWPTVVRRLAAREAKYEPKFPLVRGVSSVLTYKIVMALLVVLARRTSLAILGMRAQATLKEDRSRPLLAGYGRSKTAVRCLLLTHSLPGIYRRQV
jgi:hypothetical protein